MPHFDSPTHLQLFSSHRKIPLPHRSHIRPLVDFQILLHINSLKMKPVVVGSRRHSPLSFQRQIRHHGQLLALQGRCHRPQASWRGSHRRFNLGIDCRSKAHTQRPSHFGLLCLIIPTNQNQRRLFSIRKDQRLHLILRHHSMLLL